eukprot:366511-Chlamydomonas_euryale.AAC.8
MAKAKELHSSGVTVMCIRPCHQRHALQEHACRPETAPPLQRVQPYQGWYGTTRGSCHTSRTSTKYNVCSSRRLHDLASPVSGCPAPPASPAMPADSIFRRGARSVVACTGTPGCAQPIGT